MNLPDDFGSIFRWEGNEFFTPRCYAKTFATVFLRKRKQKVTISVS
jgi:hypothetical protein